MDPLSSLLWAAVEAAFRPALISLALSLAWMLIILIVPTIRCPAGLLTLALASLPVLLWEAGPPFLVINLLLYAVVSFAIPSAGTAGARWSRAWIFIVFLGILYAVARWVWPAGIGIPFRGWVWHWSSFDMFLLLRAVALLWESGSGKVRTLGPAQFLIWAALPVTFLGPLLRYSQFLAQWNRFTRPGETCGPTGAGWWRQFLAPGGMLVGWMAIHWAAAQLAGSSHGRLRLLLNTFLFAPWGFLFASAAVLRCQEILGQKMGLLLPPSFVRPFGRTNLSDFWSHWNMTVTSLFRDMLFYSRWGRKTANPYVNTVILFTLVGLWHDSNAYWAIWGFLHGCMFAVFLWWRKHRDRVCPANIRSRLPRRDLWSAVLTYAVVCLMWTIPGAILKVLSRGGVPGIAH